ncbi:hypothetical protein F4806DRAFT_188374 [Annulohypoxylon nitens]|nr:hypothetical protein F4806DRAFT_188374 [Annulohypoxylon nitens]
MNGLNRQKHPSKVRVRGRSGPPVRSSDRSPKMNRTGDVPIKEIVRSLVPSFVPFNLFFYCHSLYLSSFCYLPTYYISAYICSPSYLISINSHLKAKEKRNTNRRRTCLDFAFPAKYTPRRKSDSHPPTPFHSPSEPCDALRCCSRSCSCCCSFSPMIINVTSASLRCRNWLMWPMRVQPFQLPFLLLNGKRKLFPSCLFTGR